MTVPGTYSGQPLPDGWRWVRLGDVIQEVQAGFACGERDAEGIVQLRMNNLDTRGNFIWDDVLRVPRSGKNIEPFLLMPGDVLFNNTNSTELVGKSALFTGYTEPVVYSNHFTRLRSNRDALLPDVLSSWLNQQWQQGVFADLCNRWIGQSAVKADKLLNLQIPLPPFAEQQRIAGVLREQMAAVEKARAAAQVRLAASDALTSACLRAVFDTSEAAMWPTKRLGKVLVPHKEIIHPGDRESGAATFVGLEHLESHTGRRIGSLPLDLARLTGRKPTFRKGQIVYGYLRPYLNKVWIAEFDGCSSVDQFAYEVRSDIADVRFVAWFMRSPTYLRRSEVLTTTGQLPRIGTEQIAAVEIGLPPLDEQRVIADEIDRRFATRQKLRDLLRDEADAIEKLPAALLRKVFEGKQ
jgi:type I restriction enzyme, S subunit